MTYLFFTADADDEVYEKNLKHGAWNSTWVHDHRDECEYPFLAIVIAVG